MSGLNTATEKFAELAQVEVNESVEADASFLRNTTDFIQKLGEISEPFPDNNILFCFNVQKLYPSIPKKEGHNASREALDGRSKALVSSTDEIMEVISTVLENNNFNLGDNYYI